MASHAIINPMKNLYIATIGEDFACWVKKTQSGLELDQFCMAENLDEPKYESCCKEIRRLFTDCKVSAEHAVLHAPFNELHPAAIDPLAKDLARHRMEQAYTACKDLGISKMVVHSGYVPHIYFKSWHQEQSVKFWTGFMADKPADFQLCIENVLEDEPQMMADMLKDIDQPNIGICLDIGHANCMSDVPVSQWIQVLSPYIEHFHLHNNDGSYDWHAPFDEGSMDIHALLQQAKELCKPDTTYTVEVIHCGKAMEWLENQKNL